MSTPWKKSDCTSVTPYLIVENVVGLIGFLETAFDATLNGRLNRPNGSLMHAEVTIGDAVVMMGEPMGAFGTVPASMFLYVPDPDATYAKAIAAGAESLMEITDHPHAGTRYGGVKDPSGNMWWIGSHLEDLTWEEQQSRINATASLWSSEDA